MDDDKVIPIGPVEIIAEVGGVVDETRVTLGVHGEDLEPDEISDLLNCKPTHAHRRGALQPRSRRPWPHGAWLLSVEGKAPTEPEALLRTLLAMLPDDLSLWTKLRQRFTIQIGFGLFIGAWNRGFELSPAVLKRVAELGLSLGFDIYADGQEGDS